MQRIASRGAILVQVGPPRKRTVLPKKTNALNAQENIRFSVDQRAVRDRLQKITKVFKRRMAAEERASGINLEKTELDEALENVIERSEGAQEEILRGDSEKRRQAEKDRETAEDVRKR